MKKSIITYTKWRNFHRKIYNFFQSAKNIQAITIWMKKPIKNKYVEVIKQLNLLIAKSIQAVTIQIERI